MKRRINILKQCLVMFMGVFSAACPAEEPHAVKAVREPGSDAARYFVVDLSGGAGAAKRATRTNDAPPDVSRDACRTSELWLRRLPGTNGLAVCVFEITQAQYAAVTGGNPSRHEGSLRPVENVSWNEAMAFADALSRQTGLAVDLPTDSEWEFACRAGTRTAFYNGKNPHSHLSPELAPIARYGNNRHDGKGGGYVEHVNVGSYEPNSWGLYDMLGNVSEWTKDWLSKKFPSNRYKTLRGGNWYPCMGISTAFACTASSRIMAWYVGSTPEWKSDLAGFRVVVRENGRASK